MLDARLEGTQSRAVHWRLPSPPPEELGPGTSQLVYERRTRQLSPPGTRPNRRTPRRLARRLLSEEPQLNSFARHTTNEPTFSRGYYN